MLKPEFECDCVCYFKSIVVSPSGSHVDEVCRVTQPHFLLMRVINVFFGTCIPYVDE